MEITLAEVQTIAENAAELLQTYWQKVSFQYAKEFGNYVTEADLAVNEFITEIIKNKYPKHGILSEEGDTTFPSNEYVWIIDPLDGTRNFLTKIPLYGVMVSVCRKKQIELCCIVIPASGEVYTAERSKGAFCNGEQLHCSKEYEFTKSNGIYSYMRPTKHRAAFFTELARRAPADMRVASYGSSAYDATLVATGRRDWLVFPAIKPWDAAGPALLCQESGCKATDLTGKPWEIGDTDLVISAPALHHELLELLTHVH